MTGFLIKSGYEDLSYCKVVQPAHTELQLAGNKIKEIVFFAQTGMYMIHSLLFV